ncbi:MULTISPECIES: alanine--tRNA ligase [Treponema]|uniref:Alanine--tRNA ligase n=1 Tax=Treponema denticola (strain ATCC 35405 / DSM 14222 / CIP 103919 / JCM 8153 / KCTC 15104) TaxID=243275 RepID=SYA_TREDE|nr:MULTISPECIES: alanine--tRNA ligase [Treponema]P61708.1 RecName: Full=Alanine--tRNA ligase; AltName: Full=Alanyl-tRNA synthetase; Short=AlaRS [Treponema denticola ATCC 35405]AAS12175.1 alanyl-tRNA synthetase [Treponema denticola ATCC 35405]EMB37798.1 alanyl-tRNA synthetase [Treponema denticola ATCC 33521]EMB40348.1 alanyl-tRNA synthetase [Treponema denticola ATCC 35404]UTC87573.1 alanine--tRNA ligase [Treponema denticola]HCY94629.1 alanine--tRNA ligase [Treponema sp.]
MNKNITIDELRSKYIDFFKSKGHVEISGRSLIPENDPTVLFTTAGMHPLVPYLMGEPHPAGTRLTDVQKCVRTGDIDDVGDASHLTFFEMLGNWSLGDYFKKESIAYSFEFLTDEKYLGIPIDKLSFTVFEGNEDAPRDEESASIWESLGVSKDRIFFLPKEDNWWGPAGETGPCGPDTEIFIDTGKPACGSNCRPGCNCGKYVEIWNNVFMQYHKNMDGSYSPLKRKCVDTGMGVERTVAMLQGKPSVYNTEAFTSIIKSIEDISGVKYGDNEKTDTSIRIIADHVRTACFILGDPKTTLPSNIGAGYVLRRLIRRAVRHGKKLGIDGNFLSVPASAVIAQNAGFYTELKENETLILTELKAEEDKFLETLKKGEAEFEKMLPNLLKNPKKIIPGRMAFKLYDTYGFPIELTEELASESGLTVNREEFDEAFKKHQELSRAGSEQVFKGGLADHSEQTTAYHTATHLLHKALRMVLGDHVQQKGSNITAERLRFDFSHPEPMTEAEKKEVERLVNEAIKADLPVTMEVMPLEEAKKIGAMALFGEKYEDVVKVYKIGDFSTEVCGGPHVERTGSLGRFCIKKEQSSSSGVRRIRAVLEH